MLERTMAAFSTLYVDATCYLAAVPTYIGGFSAFGWASDNAALRHVPASELAKRREASGVRPRYYTPDVHLASFALPVFVRDIVERATTR